MNSMAHILSTEPPWVELLILARPQTPKEITGEMPREYRRMQIGSKTCRTRGELFSTFASALAFPSYFGENWDAFEECINDMEWMPATGYLIIVSEAEYLLIDDEEQEYEIFVSIMQEAGKRWATPQSGEWARPAIPFHALLLVSDDKLGTRNWHVPLSRLE